MRLFFDNTEILEELRAAKTPDELEQMRKAADSIVDSMAATFHWLQEGMTETRDRRAFAAGAGRPDGLELRVHFDRYRPNVLAGGPSSRKVKKGEIISLDTGGQWHGYLADMARMGVLGEPTHLMKELLDEVAFCPSRRADFRSKRGARWEALSTTPR